MRTVWRQILLVVIFSVSLGGVALAAAKRPAKTTTTSPVLIGRGHNGYAVNAQLFIDSHGTVNAAWVGTAGTRYVTDYARKTAKSTSFTHVTLPDARGPGALDQPIVFQTASGDLEIFTGDFSQGFSAWRSSNDGKSWKSINTSAITALKANNILIASVGLTDGPGGPLQFAGDNGDPAAPIVQLKGNLSGVTTLTTNTAQFQYPEVAKALDGTLYMLGQGPTSNLNYSAGTNTGKVKFPCATGYGYTAAGGSDTQTLAAGKSVAVVAFSGCGHVWTRTITPAGVLGPVTTIGVASRLSVEDDYVAVRADSHGHFTAIYAVPGGDLGVAHSSDGAHWTTAPGFLPTAGGAITELGITKPWLSSGEPTWFTANGYGLALTDTYRTPVISSAGIADPHKARLGSLAAVVPRIIPLKSWAKTGETAVKVVDAIPGPVAVAVSDSRMSGSTTIDVCQGGPKAAVKLKADKAQTVKLSCGSGAIVIGGSAASGIAAKKGDLVTFTVTDRGQSVTLISHVK